MELQVLWGGLYESIISDRICELARQNNHTEVLNYLIANRR